LRAENDTTCESLEQST